MCFRRPCLLLLSMALWLGAGDAQAQMNDPYLAWTEATVYRDEWGVPHVYGWSPRAMAFAFGYAQAEDHLEGMLLAYRVANGRAAEVLGEGYAPSDEFALKMGHAVLAQDALLRADPLTVDLCEGFAQGVNAWLVQHPDRAPAWAEGVRPADILSLLHCYLLSFAPFDLPEAFRPLAASSTGNAWAVAPTRSATGEAMLVLNPHMYFDGPFRWYEAHLVCGEFNVSGATLFGLPVILQGHNDTLGWALTPNRPDFADVYAEMGPTVARDPASVNAPQIDPRILLQAQIAQNSRVYYVMTDNGLEERQASCLFTSNGPMMGEHRGRICTYRAGGYGAFGALRQFFEMGRARDMAAFQAAWGMQQIPCFHVVYADREGNIFYLYNTVVGGKATAIEASPEAQPAQENTIQRIDWNLPLPSENPVYTWGAVIPAAALPALLNPASGYVQACGNPPWLATDESRMDPASLPPWLALDEDTFRARRARHLLRLGSRSFDEMQAMLYDSMSSFGLEAAPALLEAADENAEFIQDAHPDLPVGLDLLRSWNYTGDTDSTGMTFFHVWWMALQEAAARNFRSPVQLMDAVRARVPELQEVTLQAAAEAAKRMRNEYQSLSMPWGDVHRIRRGDKDLPLAGGDAGDPLFFSSDLRLQEGRWTANYGYGYAMVVRFGETPQAVSMVPFGASESPDSPHYADQLDLMTQQRFKPAYFQLDEVLLHAQSAFGRNIELHPAGLDGRIVVRTPVPVSVRLETTAEPPAPLPDGLGTFTIYAAVRDLAAGSPVDVAMEARISEELCDTEGLERLAVYGYDEEGWQRIEDQQLDLETGVFVARDSRARLYAVLGPEGLRKTEDAPKAIVPAPPVKRRAYDGILEASSDPELPKPEAMAGASPLPESGEAEPDKPAASAVPKPQLPEALAKAEAPAASASSEAPPAAPVKNEVPLITNAEVAKAEAMPPAPEPAKEERKKMALRDLKPVAFGPSASGRELGLWTPDRTSMLLFTAKMNCEARLVTLPQAPARLPEGMAVFSSFLGIERNPYNVKGDLAIKLLVPEATCAKEDLNRLRLYIYTDERGWYEAKGQKVGVEDRSVSGLDTLGEKLTLYAILGPQECRKK